MTVKSTTSTVELSLASFPALDEVYFSYLYLSNIYSSQRVCSVFQGLDKNSYNLEAPYDSFAYTPASSSLFFAVKKLTSSTTPFFGLTTYNENT